MPYRAPELFDVDRDCVVDEKTDGTWTVQPNAPGPQCANNPGVSVAVWSLGATLYALYFGYSPFEVEFNSLNEARVVECTHLRVIGEIKFPRDPSRYVRRLAYQPERLCLP